MGQVTKIARRTFLIGSAAIAGGVAFGVYSAKKPFANPNLDDLPDGAASFNPWVIITKEAITLIAPHGDKGQGIFSAQAALIAEELDADLSQVTVSFGNPDKAYYNRAMAGSLVPFMSVDHSKKAEFFRDVAGGAVKLFLPMQATGGSSSIPDSYQKLREAGAIARETLKRAAAKMTKVHVSKLSTAHGAVILPDGTKINYTELAERAGKIKPVKKVALRDPKDWKIIGKPMKRLDMPAKVTGTLPYSIDHSMPDMVYATVKMNPRQMAALNGYDASGAKYMRGIKDIIEITGGVAVIADNTWRAMQAANAIKFDWAPAPYPADQEQHWQEISDSFIEERINDEPRNVGNVDAAEGSQLTAEYRSPYVAHAPLEPLACTILVTDNRVDIWTGHQIQLSVEEFVSEITGIKRDHVHLHNMFMGGSFGHRLEFEFVKQAAEIATKLRGTPVKMTYSREEDFAHDFPRHITMGRATGKVDQGKVVSLDVQIAAPSVINSQMGRMGMEIPGPDSQLQEGAWDNPYFNLPNLRVRSYKVPELAPVSSWRSVGAAPNGFIFDTFLDEAIHAAGADPLEERIRLMGHDVSVKVLEAVGEMSSWGGELKQGRARGVSYVISFGVPVAQIIEVNSTSKGIKIEKVWMAADVGKVIDPVNLQNLAQGGVVFGLGHAMNCEITYKDGMSQQSNYHQHEGMRLYQCPDIEFRALENAEQIRGFGEPPVPPTAPALGNAIFAATGKRLREMPFNKFVDFI
ncbi:MAG: molybdopterin cofactor-binding domain-containing protein [bacterium]